MFIMNRVVYNVMHPVQCTDLKMNDFETFFKSERLKRGFIMKQTNQFFLFGVSFLLFIMMGPTVIAEEKIIQQESISLKSA